MSFILPETDNKPRDANGQFIKEGTPPEDTVKTSFETDGPDIIPASSSSKSNKKISKDFLDEPLVSLKIQNPFKKILQWLNDIRKKQTTTFDFKISIPLIALPIFLVVLGSAFSFFFNLGKSTSQKEIASKPTPTSVIIMQTPKVITASKIGIVKATYQFHTTPTITSSDNSATTSPTLAPSPLRYVLTSGSSYIFLASTQNIGFVNYLNQRVLMTGQFDTELNILKIEKETDIEILP